MELRQDNESMAKELRRLQEANAKLKLKYDKLKARYSERTNIDLSLSQLKP